MLYTGILIGFCSALLASFVTYVFIKNPISGKVYEVEVKTGNGWHKGKVHFKKVSKLS